MKKRKDKRCCTNQNLTQQKGEGKNQEKWLNVTSRICFMYKLSTKKPQTNKQTNRQKQLEEKTSKARNTHSETQTQRNKHIHN